MHDAQEDVHMDGSNVTERDAESYADANHADQLVAHANVHSDTRRDIEASAE